MRELRVRVLSDLKVGDSAILVALDLPLGVQNHLMHMGFVTDAEVKAVHRAPAGDPTVYSVDGIDIALRRETARLIQIDEDPLAIRKATHPSDNSIGFPNTVHEQTRELIAARVVEATR